MRIGIDITGMFTGHRTGVANDYYGLIEGLVSLKEETAGLEFVLVDRSLQESHTPPFALPESFEFRSPGPISRLPTLDSPPRSPIGGPARLWNRGVREIGRRATGWQTRAEQIVGDLDLLEGWDEWLRIAPHAKRVIIIPDVIPILFPQLFDPDHIRNVRRSLVFARDTADLVVATSYHAKQTFVEHGGVPESKIRVIYLGVRPIFKPLEDRGALASVLSRYRVPDKPYILTVGYLDPRKNIRGQVRAFERLAESQAFSDLQMVLVGAASLTTDEVMRDIQASPVRERVHVTGYVSDADLPLILAGARALTYCSFFEGFGYPVLEAMACGVPVVTSNSTSLPEVAGDAAILVNPHDVDQIASGLSRILSDVKVRDELRERGLARVRQFTWENWARGHLQVYRDCLSSRN